MNPNLVNLAKETKDLDIGPERSRSPLFVATLKDNMYPKLWMLDLDLKKRTELFYPMPEPINAICIHENEFYVASSRFIYTYENLNEKEPSIIKIARRPGTVFALCSHRDHLYDAGTYAKVFDTLEDKLGEAPMAVRSDAINSLASCSGRLYDAGDCQAIFNTIQDPQGISPLIDRDFEITDLCSHDNKLFHSADRYVCHGNTLRAVRNTPITAVVSHNGTLYDCCKNNIFDTEEHRIVYSFDARITAACTGKK
jgi:hypothetical protein